MTQEELPVLSKKVRKAFNLNRSIASAQSNINRYKKDFLDAAKKCDEERLKWATAKILSWKAKKENFENEFKKL